ncbi:MAG: aminotransferase class V-fold PLP-dependent enzyme [Ignavibacteria bacterium]|nr:aminotransferase class V-fold PLP-dependent enzyme [Ignavibacteria bacterium]
MLKTLAELRSLYPYLQTGKIYFNHAACSPLSRPVLDKMNAFIAMRSESTIDDYPWILDTIQRTRVKIGELLNCDPRRVAFTDNTSNGLNILARGLQWKTRDEILLNSIEFPSNVYPFMNLQSEGVSIRFIPDSGGIVSAESIIQAVTPRTKLISLSFVQFLSGYRADLKLLGDFCRQHDIIFCVDGIQGLGAIQLDVTDCNISFLATGTQKWLMGDMGTGFIYISEELQQRVQPHYVGWLSVKDAWNLLDFRLTLKDTADVFQTGTLNSLGIFALNGALETFELTGAENRERMILDNTGYFLEKLTAKGFNTVLHGVRRENLSGIVTIRTGNGQQLFDNLSARNIVCSLREGMIRFSPHYYNTREEIDCVVESMMEIQNSVR